MADEALRFLDDDITLQENSKEPWYILIVDDEPSVHEVTKLALKGFTYEGRGLELVSAYSKKEAATLFGKGRFAVVLIDVVMETDSAGLELVEYIRKEAQDEEVRLIIRTGQPGTAPERFVIDHYDINDYKEKTELTVDRIYTTMRTALSQYQKLLELGQKQEELQTRLHYDALTGLPNRNLLHDDLVFPLSRSLILIDTDFFGMINDAYGFEFGDRVLQFISVELQKLLVDRERVYHLEADHFAIVIEHGDKIRLERLKEALINLSHRLKYESDGVSARISFSMGIVIEESEELIQKAYMAIRQARSVSRNRVQVYHESMQMVAFMQENAQWTKLLNTAIEQRSLVPYFQPILNIKTGQVEKYEALVRMHLNGTIVCPHEFLGAARFSGMLPQITKIVLEKTAKIFADNSYSFSINVTDQDFAEEGFVDFVKDTLHRYRIDPKRVVFELLEENSLKKNPEALNVIHQLSELGCNISIDDFGVECSNYAQLITNDLESIKIDGSFIKEIDKSSNCYLVVDAIIYFAKKVGVKTVAEYVHSKAVFEKVKEMGVDFAQGYYIGEPKEEL